MNVGAAGTVSELGSPLHPGRPLDGKHEAGPCAARLREAGRAGRSRPATTRWWPDGTAWPWRHSPRPGRSWTGRTSWRPPADRRVSGAGPLAGAAGNAAAGELVRVSHDGAARGIGGLLEDYAFCADGFLALYSVTERPLVHAVRGGDFGGRAGGSWPAGGSPTQPGNRNRFQTPRAASRAWTPSTTPRPAVLRPLPGSCSATPPCPGPRNTGPWPETSCRSCRRSQPVRPAWRAGCWPQRRPRWRARWRPPSSDLPVPKGTALHRALLLSPSPGLVVAVGDAEAAPPRKLPEAVPLLRRRPAGPDGAPLVYVCRGMVCDRPVATVCRRLLERSQLSTAMTIATKWAAKASTVKAWNSSWKPKCP